MKNVFAALNNVFILGSSHTGAIGNKLLSTNNILETICIVS